MTWLMMKCDWRSQVRPPNHISSTPILIFHNHRVRAWSFCVRFGEVTPLNESTVSWLWWIADALLFWFCSKCVQTFTEPGILAFLSREKSLWLFSALLENVSFVDIQTFKKLAQEHLEIEKPGLRYIKIIYHLTDHTEMEQNPSHIVPSENLSFSGKPQGEDEI